MTIIDEYTSYLDEYVGIYGDKTIVLMEIGLFFEMYSVDRNDQRIQDVTNVLNIVVTRKNKNIAEINSSNPLMAGFPSSMVDKYATLLIEAGYTIVVVEQVSLSPKPKREVTHVWSPATFTTLISQNECSNYICHLYVTRGSNTRDCYALGTSLIDCSTGYSYIDETVSNRMRILQVIVNIGIRFRPSEVIISHDDQHCLEMAKEITKSFTSSKIHHQELKAETTKMVRMRYILESAFKNESQLGIFEYLNIESMPHGIISLGNLIAFLNEMKSHFANSVKNPERINEPTNMEVSYNSFDQLNITSGAVSLLSLLNHCRTSIGRRYFRRRLLTPSRDANFIKSSYELIDLFSSVDHELLKESLSSMKDIEKIYYKSTSWTLRDVLSFQVTLQSIKDIRSNVQIETDFIFDWAPLDFINSAFDFDSSPELFHGSKLSSDDETVFKVRSSSINELSRTIQEAKQEFVDFAHKINSEHFKVEHNDREGYYLVCTTKRYEQHLQDTSILSKCSVVQKRNGYYKVSIPNATQYNDLIVRSRKDLQIELQEMFENDVNKLKSMLQRSGVIETYVNAIEFYDFYFTNNLNKSRLRLSKPTLSSSTVAGYLKAKDLRHPIVEHVNEDLQYIPNDICLENNGILLYGVNASGKSCFMKSVAIAVIMAQAGMFVASKEFVYSPFSNIFTRITSNDNLFRRQSTFMLEMSELREILNRSDSKSLVLGDELCSGTETISGISIVCSAIRHLSKSRSCFLFASHLHELSDMIKDTTTEVFHFKVRIDSQNIWYERKIEPGGGDTLYGLEVCKSLDMDSTFIEEAFEIRRTLLTPVEVRQSRYNSNKYFTNKCEICQKSTDQIDIHHIKEQRHADKHGNIDGINKNAVHNLVPLCKECHDAVHDGKITIKGYRQTSHGRILELIDPKDSK